MNKNTILTTKKELRTTIRDKKSLVMMFVMPLFIPIFIFMMSMFYTSIMEGIEDIHVVGYNYELSEVEKEILDSLNLEFKYYDATLLHDAYENDEIVAYVILENDIYTVYANPDAQNSITAGSGVITYLATYNNYLAQLYLIENEINPENVFNIIQYEKEEITGNNDMVNQLLFIGFVFAIMSITLSAVQAATDSTAGEKERGTLETLLTFPIKSQHLIMGKYTACVITCMATAILSGILLVISLFAVKNMFPVYDNVMFSFSGLSMVLAFALLIGYSLFISGVSIVIASLTKTYKEAQSTLQPLTFVTLVPMFMNMMGAEISELISVIPIVNHTLLLNEILMGNINVLHISLMLISTVIYIAIVIKYLISQYKSEKILFSI